MNLMNIMLSEKKPDTKNSNYMLLHITVSISKNISKP